MPTATTANVFDMSKFCYMAFDGSKFFFTHFCQFLGSNLGIFPNLFFYPNIKCITLGAILSATLRDIYS